MKLLIVLSLCFAAALSMPMDIGSGGVYDSPLANDFYVRQFGWLFGGGRSGIYGLKAMQGSVDAYDRLNEPTMHQTSLQDTVVQEKNMVELSPLMMDAEGPKPKMFHRFMAVP